MFFLMLNLSNFIYRSRYSYLKSMSHAIMVSCNRKFIIKSKDIVNFLKIFVWLTANKHSDDNSRLTIFVQNSLTSSGHVYSWIDTSQQVRLLFLLPGFLDPLVSIVQLSHESLASLLSSIPPLNPSPWCDSYWHGIQEHILSACPFSTCKGILVNKTVWRNTWCSRNHICLHSANHFKSNKCGV